MLVYQCMRTITLIKYGYDNALWKGDYKTWNTENSGTAEYQLTKKSINILTRLYCLYQVYNAHVKVVANPPKGNP